MSSSHFTDEIDVYTVLTLRLQDYHATERQLPEGFAIASFEQRDIVRNQEKALLRAAFSDWDIPYCGKLPGWRNDSPMYVIAGERLAGGLYLCDRNEFDRNEKYGQLHYAFLAREYQGLGLYTIMFRKVVERAAAWGLSHIYLNSDRYLLPEVYLRWGAQPYKQIAKESAFPALARLAWVYKPLRQMKRELSRVWRGLRSPCN